MCTGEAPAREPGLANRELSKQQNITFDDNRAAVVLYGERERHASWSTRMFELGDTLACRRGSKLRPIFLRVGIGMWGHTWFHNQCAGQNIADALAAGRQDHEQGQREEMKLDDSQQIS